MAKKVQEPAQRPLVINVFRCKICGQLLQKGESVVSHIERFHKDLFVVETLINDMERRLG